MDNQIIIRRADSADVESIVSFNIAMALETEKKILRRDEALPGVTNLLQAPQNGFYIVAESAGQLVGSLMITFEWSDWRNGMFWWLQSVYIKPEFRRRGIFTLLYNYVKELALAQSNVCGLRLYVHRGNDKALYTYSKMGMRETEYALFETEF